MQKALIFLLWLLIAVVFVDALLVLSYTVIYDRGKHIVIWKATTCDLLTYLIDYQHTDNLLNAAVLVGFMFHHVFIKNVFLVIQNTNFYLYDWNLRTRLKPFLIFQYSYLFLFKSRCLYYITVVDLEMPSKQKIIGIFHRIWKVWM